LLKFIATTLTENLLLVVCVDIESREKFDNSLSHSEVLNL